MLNRREWTDKAACAESPNDELTWVIEPSRGHEEAATVVKLLTVCQGCPVRMECLLDALGEQAFRVEGCWGGTVRTERSAALRMAGTPKSYRGDSAERRDAVKRVADALDGTLDERIELWKTRAKKGVR